MIQFNMPWEFGFQIVFFKWSDSEKCNMFFQNMFYLSATFDSFRSSSNIDFSQKTI